MTAPPTDRGRRLPLRRVKTRALAVTALAAVSLLAAGEASATTIGPGTPKNKLAAYGDHLYGEYCLSCHGGNAAGRTRPATIGAGPLRVQSQQRAVAPSLQGVGALAADFYLRTGFMPLRHLGLQPRRRRVLLTNRQIRALVAYIATFGGPPIPTPRPQLGNVSRGMTLFADNCAGCHQIVAQGGYVTGATPPPLVEGTTPLQVAEAVRIGPFVMPRFSQKQISNRQLDSIIAYVDYVNHPDHPGGWPLNFLGPVPEGLVTWFIAATALIGFCVVIGRRLRR